MTHEHGSEYRVRTVHEDETEELSEWMSCREEVAQAITGVRAEAYWLQVRDVLCGACPNREPAIVEFRLTLSGAGNARFSRPAERKAFGSASRRTSSAGA
jgi:hypothetical protein